MSSSPEGLVHTAGTEGRDPVPRPRRHGLLRAVIWTAVVGAIAALWLHSRGRCDYVALCLHGGRVQGMASDGGRVYVVFSNLPLGSERSFTLHRGSMPREHFDRLREGLFADDVGKIELLGFGASVIRDSPYARPITAVTVQLPHGFIAGVAAVGAFVTTRGLLRQRRWRRTGRCLNCGYDLRATTGLCPECGAPVAAHAAPERAG